MTDPDQPLPLCPDCQAAERDPLHAVYRGELCCKARAIAAAPTRMRRQAADAICSGLSVRDAHAVRVRAYEIEQRAARHQETQSWL